MSELQLDDIKEGDQLLDTATGEVIVYEDMEMDGPLFRLPNEDPPFDSWNPSIDRLEELLADGTIVRDDV